MVPVGERALAWVNRYLVDVRPRWAPVPDDNWLFLTHDGTEFSPSRLTQMARNYIKASGVGKQGPAICFVTRWRLSCRKAAPISAISKPCWV